MIKNIWWTSFVGVFAFGFIIVLMYCYLNKSFTLGQISLSEWLNYFAACGTIGGFLYLILDKVLSQKEINHLKWQSQIPFVTLNSPCDPTSNYCDIDILTYQTPFHERGSGYFSICNLGKINAYDIKILFYSKENYIDSNIFHRHYIPYLPPLVTHTDSYGNFSYSFKEFIYSNFNINPDTKEISNNKFEICGCLANCQLSNTNTDEKFFFVKIEYSSSFSKKHLYKITSTLRITVICTDNNDYKVVKIKGINFLDYDYEDI